MQLFYNPSIETNSFLEKEENNHATKVLRKQAGDVVHIMDGKGNLYHCEISAIHSKKSLVKILKKEEFSKSNHLHIAIAPTKNNNRMEFFLEKATEIGIAEITPLLCSRSERKIIKTERMEKIILSAAKQSKNFHLPLFNPMISFEKFIQQLNEIPKFIAHCEDELNKKSINDYQLTKQSPAIILIGPEGDFTEKEISLAKQEGYKELSLGESRLRTETAGIVAATLYNAI